MISGPMIESGDAEKATDYWTYTITAEGTVTGSGSGVNNPSAAGASGTTGKYMSNDGSHIGSWGFDEMGYGPFGSFYAAFDGCHGNNMVCRLNPNDLKYSVDRTISVDTDDEGSPYYKHTLNIMWILPTIYWDVNDNGDLILSNDPSKGIAYAHTTVTTEDGIEVTTTYKYLGIGVYEAGIADIDDMKRVLTSQSGTKPADWAVMSGHGLATNNVVATVDGITPNGHAMCWNLYAWQLYRFCVLTVGGGWDSQGIFGNGDVCGHHYEHQESSGDEVTTYNSNRTGELDESGPYAGTIGTSDSSDSNSQLSSDPVKVFIENAWGSLEDIVHGISITGNYNGSKNIHMYATQKIEPTSLEDYTEIGILPRQWGYSATKTTAETNPAFWGLPTETTGSQTSGLYDRYVTGSGLFFVVGGYSSSSTSNPGAGLSYIYVDRGINYQTRTACDRLEFVFDVESISTRNIMHHVTYNVNGGSASAPSQSDVQEGQTFNVASYSGTKTGYSFGGWSNGTTTYQANQQITMGSSDITLTAVWNAVKHHVTYNVNGGSASAPSQSDVQEGQTFNVASYSGTKTGYSFGGWSNGTTTYQANQQITMGSSDITLTAVWNAVKHHVTYNVNGGSASAPSQSDVQEGQKFTVSTYSGSKIGYSFGGWSYNGNTYQAGSQITMGSSDITLTAVWDPVYTITFDANGGSCTVLSMNTDVDGRLSSLPSPEYGGHDFDGWFTAKTGGTKATESTVFDRNTALYAHWTAQSVQPTDPDPSGHTVTLDPNGGSCSVSSLTTDPNRKISSLPTATRQGYSFTGWFTASTGGNKIDQSTEFDEDSTVYAQWKHEYIIAFDANGGTCSIGSLQTIDGKLPYLPEPTFQGHDFLGWYTSASDGENVTSSYRFSENITVYAQWTAQSVQPADQSGHTVTLDPNGGSCSVSSLITDSDGKLSSLPTPTLSGHGFSGWHTSASGGIPVSADTVFEQDATIYAHWTEASVEPEPGNDTDPETPNGSDNGEGTSFPLTAIAAGCAVAVLMILGYVVYRRPKY